MINTIKWTIFYRTHKDKDRSLKIFNLIWDKLGCESWGDQWTDEQQDLFYEQIELLLPIRNLEEQQSLYELVREVFGEVIIKDDTTQRHLGQRTQQLEEKG